MAARENANKHIEDLFVIVQFLAFSSDFFLLPNKVIEINNSNIIRETTA